MNRKQISPTVVKTDRKSLSGLDFKSAQTFEGQGLIPFAWMPRLLEELALDGVDIDQVGIAYQFETWIDERAGGPDEYRLRFHIWGDLPLICQKCLSVYSETLDEEAQFQLLETEEEVENFPLDDEFEDVLVNSAQFHLLDVIEDEILLSIPLMPRHTEKCPTASKNGENSPKNGEKSSNLDENEEIGKKPNPFEILKKMKFDN